MIRPIQKANVGKIFQGETCLHVIIWDRFNETINTRGLTLMKDLIRKFDLVMPMLRPIGRSPKYYSEDSKAEFKYPPPNRFCQGVPSTLLLDANHTGHCELWIQVSNIIKKDLLEFLKSFFNEQGDNFAIFLNHKMPDWAPLGKSYAKTRYDLGTKIDYEINYDISKKQLPGFLKLIWYLSSEVIADWFSAQGQNISWIDPLAQKDVLFDLMGRIFADINPKEYGISSTFDSIDPSDFGAAHMAALAINAITKVSNVYQIEQYFRNSNITRPYNYPNRDEFLKVFCR